jgi:hypothetical protein
MLQRKCEFAGLQRDLAWTSAILWIGQACHSGAMAPLTNRSYGVRRIAPHLTISTTMRVRPRVVVDDEQSALR